MVVKRVMFLFLARCHSWWSVYGQGLPLRQEPCLRRSTGTLHSTIFTKIYNFTNSCCMSFWWVENVGFPPKRCFKNRGTNPTFSAGNKSPYPPRGQTETESWPWSSKFFRNPSTVVWRPGKQGLKSWWFWDSSRSNKSNSRTCTFQDRSRTAQHGYVPLLVHQSLPIISSCKICMSLQPNQNLAQFHTTF